MSLRVCISHRTLVTPVNKNPYSNSNRDYHEQVKRAECGEQVLWDDGKGNRTKQVGGMFGFVHNGKKVEFHMITQICSTKERLSTWSDNVGQQDRNVLMLTPCLFTMNWDKWITLGCPSKIQGTTHIVSAHESLASYLDSKCNNLVYIQDTNECIL
jgi:hypothetical protein